MRDVLVTGGAGFLGSHLCERLLRDGGTRVHCLDDLSTGRLENLAGIDDDGFELVLHDVIEPYHGHVDEIFHLACPASPVHYQRDPVRTLDTTFSGTRAVLELARATGARVLLASTSEVYGDPQEHPQQESYWGHVNPLGPRACYDEGKRAAEALAVAYRDHRGVDARIARIFNTYGPRMDERDGRVVANFGFQALRGRPLTIYGDGSQTRSFCYVADLIEGLVRLMRARVDPGPVNLGNPQEVTVLELARLVLELTGAEVPIEHRPLPCEDPTRRRPEISRARQHLGWRPRTPLREGLALTLAEFRARVAAGELPAAAPEPLPLAATAGGQQA